MRNFYLIFTFILLNTFNLKAQCNDQEINLTTQADIDNFATDYGCTVLDHIRLIIDGNDITNLNGLSELTAITTQDYYYDYDFPSDLIIRDCPNLTSLSGLENLQSVWGGITIYNCDGLSNLEGLNGLEELTTGNFTLLENNGLTSLTGVNWSALSYLDLEIERCNGLSDLSGTEVGDNVRLQIRDCESLTSLDGLTGNTLSFLVITNNPVLSNIDALGNFSEIINQLVISHNSVLTNIDILSSVQLSDWLSEIQIIGNEALVNLDGLSNLTTMSLGGITIQSNNSLENIDGLNNLTTIEVVDLNYNYFSEGYLKIAYNPSLTNIDGLSNLVHVANVNLTENNVLENLDGLSSVSVLVSLLIKDNLALTNLNGLSNVEFISVDFTLENNPLLTQVDGLSNVNFFGDLTIDNNDGLEQLNGFSNVMTIEDLAILNNNALSNINGLSNLDNIYNSANISNNSSLQECCLLLGWNAFNGDVTLSNNAVGCSAIEEVAENCAEYSIQVLTFHDVNGNGLFDSNEQGVFNQNISISPDALITFTDIDGVATVYFETGGTHQINIETSELWEVNNGINSVDVNNGEVVYFPLSPLGEFTVQQLSITSSITRCNQETNYWLTYSNEGTIVTDGFIELIPDESTSFVSANPPADSTSGNTLYWFYEDLFPTHYNQIHLVYQMPSVDALGEQIGFEANIVTNEDNGNDKAILSSDLICAYDPNDKLATPFGYGNENYTLFNDTLEYTIRFQNTGNDTAFTVIIEDELSEYLDINTFRPIASSHNVETQIDATTRLATFIFNDIYLADSFVNEPASHGFVKFQILGNEDLSENTIIENTANIFFDLNPAIVTNTTSNQMVSVLPTFAILAASTDLIDFGEINLETLEGNIEPQILLIENAGDFDLIIESIAIQGTGFSVQIEELTIAGQDNAELPIYFSPSEAGIYQSQLVLQSNGGEATIDLNGSAIIGTGIPNIETSFIKLFPNPNEGQFYLTTEQTIQEYQISNSLGEIVLEQTVQNTNVSKIDLQQQPKGIYFITVQTTDGITTEKFLVQ